MTDSLAIQNVSSIGHVRGTLINPPDTPVLLEVYSGTVAINAQEHNGHTLTRQYQVLLPITDLTVVNYSPSGIMEAATMVSLGGVTGDDDETNTCSIDDFGVTLEGQTFPGVGGHPRCLVLLFSISLLNGVLHRVSYNVTLKMKPFQKPEELKLDPGTVPS